VFVAAPARAEGELALAWDAPPGCPSAALVRRRLHALAGGEVRLGDGRVRAEGHIEHADGRYRLTLVVHDGASVRTRSIEAASCADLGGAAAVALGLLLRSDTSEPTPNGADASASPAEGGARGAGGSAPDTESTKPSGSTGGANTSSAAARGAPSRNESTAHDPEAERRAPPPTPPLESPRTSPRRWSVLVRLPFVALDLGPLPKPSGSVGFDAGLRYDEWRFLVGARLFAPQTLSAADVPDVGARLHRFAVAASGCRGWRAPPFELAPCVSLALEPLAARGVGANLVGRSAHATPVVVAGGGTAYWYVVEWMALRGSLMLGVETARPRFVVGALGEARTLGPVEFSLELGPEWIF